MAQLDLEDPKSFVLIPEHKLKITRSIATNAMSFEKTNWVLNKKGLWMPSPAPFMSHYHRTYKAACGKETLYDGEHNPISKNEAQDIWEEISGQKKPISLWLNARFLSNDIIESDYRKSGSLSDAKYTRRPRQNMLENCFVDFDSLDRNGFPFNLSKFQNYRREENIYLGNFIKGSVVWFDAGSNWAYLEGINDETCSYSSLAIWPEEKIFGDKA